MPAPCHQAGPDAHQATHFVCPHSTGLLTGRLRPAFYLANVHQKATKYVDVW